MTRILFICHGNICRSPMAEFIMAELVSRRGLSGEIAVDSAATSREEIGNPIYPPARRKLREKGIPMYPHAARQVTKEDYQRFDLLLCMESWNLRNLRRILPHDPEKKIHLLLDYTQHPRDIDDPWYSGDFELAYQDILEGCQALLESLISP